ncbi:hypothetical protein P9112_006038 [Eukaryota sp. TZLM1-RC]
MNIKVFDLTYALYIENDFLSLVAALASLVPFAILSVWLYLTVIRFESFALINFIGFFANEFINSRLKNHFKHPRPSTTIATCPSSDYGFPSAHSQFISFWAVLQAYNILILRPPPPSQPTFLPHTPLTPFPMRVLISIGCFIIAFYSSI